MALFLCSWLVIILYAITACICYEIDCIDYKKCYLQTKTCINDGEDCTVFCGDSTTDQTEGCNGATIHCADGVGCNIICEKYKSCTSVTIYGNNATFLNVQTTMIGDGTNRGNEELRQSKIYCNNVASCSVNCINDYVTCELAEIYGQNAGMLNVTCDPGGEPNCRDTIIYCPSTTPSCYIYGTSLFMGTGMVGMKIYSEMGFNGVQFYGENTTASIGTLYCESGYDESCIIDAYYPNKCDATSVCDDRTITKIPTASPITNIPTTIMPTSSNPTTDIPTTTMPTSSNPTTNMPTTTIPTTTIPTTAFPTTIMPTIYPTTSQPTTYIPTTYIPTIAPLTTTTNIVSTTISSTSSTSSTSSSTTTASTSTASTSTASTSAASTAISTTQSMTEQASTAPYTTENEGKIPQTTMTTTKITDTDENGEETQQESPTLLSAIINDGLSLILAVVCIMLILIACILGICVFRRHRKKKPTHDIDENVQMSDMMKLSSQSKHSPIASGSEQVITFNNHLLNDMNGNISPSPNISRLSMPASIHVTPMFDVQQMPSSMVSSMVSSMPMMSINTNINSKDNEEDEDEDIYGKGTDIVVTPRTTGDIITDGYIEPVNIHINDDNTKANNDNQEKQHEEEGSDDDIYGSHDNQDKQHDAEGSEDEIYEYHNIVPTTNGADTPI